MRLLLIRHGESRANVDGIIQGTDDPLTDRGRAQAAALAAVLAERETIAWLYASSLMRAQETATIIGHEIGCVPILVPELAEIDAGVAAGRLWAEWRAEDPERAKRWRWEFRRATDAWDGGESGATFSARIFRALDEIIARHAASDETVAVVTHGGALSWFAARLHGDALDVWPHAHAGFANCSVSELHVNPDGSIAPVQWNVAYLPADSD